MQKMGYRMHSLLSLPTNLNQV